MAEGVVAVGPLARHMKAHQGYHGGTGVGEVIEGVGGDGDGAREHSGREFAQGEQEVQDNAHNAGQRSVALTDGGVLGVAAVFYEGFYQQVGHRTPHIGK